MNATRKVNKQRFVRINGEKYFLEDEKPGTEIFLGSDKIWYFSDNCTEVIFGDKTPYALQ